uniref:Uncharacterized protein n=1 Tax=Ascaris lumbricoides TaxID=6252 RepID=A0A0M3ICN6_ASCLU
MPERTVISKRTSCPKGSPSSTGKYGPLPGTLVPKWNPLCRNGGNRGGNVCPHLNKVFVHARQ